MFPLPHLMAGGVRVRRHRGRARGARLAVQPAPYCPCLTGSRGLSGSVAAARDRSDRPHPPTTPGTTGWAWPRERSWAHCFRYGSAPASASPTPRPRP